MRFGLLVVTLLCASAASPPTSAAQDTREAQRLFERGVELADAERWGEAAEYFRRARDVVERPSIVCNLGIALHHLGEAVAAAEALERCGELAREDAAWGRANTALVERTERLLAELALGTLVLSLDPPDALVSIDGVAVEGSGSPRHLAVDPGLHHVTVTAEGHRPWTADVSVLSGAEEERTVSLERAPDRPATLVVESLDGARIVLDGEEIGLGRVETTVASGPHHLRIEADGHETFERDLMLADGERSTIDATFGETGRELVEEPVLWIGVGAGVVAIAVAITLGVVLSAPNDPLAGYGGTTGIVLAPLVSF